MSTATEAFLLHEIEGSLAVAGYLEYCRSLGYRVVVDHCWNKQERTGGEGCGFCRVDLVTGGEKQRSAQDRSSLACSVPVHRHLDSIIKLQSDYPGRSGLVVRIAPDDRLRAAFNSLAFCPLELVGCDEHRCRRRSGRHRIGRRNGHRAKRDDNGYQ